MDLSYEPRGELETDGHATHVPHLQIDDDEVGILHHGAMTAGPERASSTSMSAPLTRGDLARTNAASLATRIVRTVEG